MLLWVLAAIGRAVLLSTQRCDAPQDCSPHEETWGLQRTLESKEVVNSVLGDERTGGDMNAAGPGALTVWGENRGEQRELMALPKKAETTKKIWKSNAMQHCTCTCLSFHLNGHPRLTG